MPTRRVTTLALAALLTASVLPPASAAPPSPPAPPAVSAAGTGAHSARGPVTDENFYFVMADRFENGTPQNDDGGLGPDPMVSGFDPTRKGFYNGGDLVGLLDQLDYIQGLGTTSIWLTPSFKNKAVQPEDNSAGYHGYWITDFTRIDPHLGTNEDLKTLIDEAHSRGMKVYFDIITNHTADVIGYQEGARTGYLSKDQVPYRDAAGVDFDDRDYAGTLPFPALDPATSFPYTPVLEPGEENLKVPEWLNDPTLYHNRGNTTFTGEDSYYGDFFGLDDLFTEQPRVVQGMTEIYQGWISDFGVDGFRIDTTKSFTSQFTTRNQMQAVLDFPFQEAARNFASRGQDATALKEFFAGDDWYTDADSNAYSLPTFLGNHDMGRIGSFVTADNPQAGESELLSRDTLAHELMYFSRGNPVVYYGDEQGFSGPGGDQDARQTMFASQVPEYLDDQLLGTDSTHDADNFDTGHPLYTRIAELADLTAEHPALRDGAHQHRYSADGPGIYAFSRINAADQREYVVALNNSTEPQTAAIPTYLPKRSFDRVYGQGAESVKSAPNGELTVTVPALSAVVHLGSGRIAPSKAAPAVALRAPVPAAADNGRIHVAADVDGSSFYEVTFEARTAGEPWTSIGTDDNFPYQVFHDVAALEPGTSLEYRAVVLDNARHTALSPVQYAQVPEPALAMGLPAEGSQVQGTVEVSATASPEKPEYEVAFERRIDGAAWTPIGSDDSSPVYTVFDDLAPLDLADGTTLQYRALLGGSVSDLRTVTVGSAIVQPDAVAAAGNFNSEMGCLEDWMPSCEQAQLVLDAADQLWKLTIADLPAGSYEFKAALNRGWEENYGAGGARDGSNIALAHPGGAVAFEYDHRTNIITATSG